MRRITLTNQHTPATTRIVWAVTATYFLATFIIFRDVFFAIPNILTGEEVIVGDELVPFFNPSSQLVEQALGAFNELTHGYEFRVRYSFLTTWMRHYLVLPFALLIALPLTVTVVYRFVVWFVTDVFKSFQPHVVALAAAAPVALVYIIMAYAKITHFYTLIIGLAMATIATLLMLHGVLFARDRWVRKIVFAALLTLFNPAVHYIVLFVVVVGIVAVTLLLGELAKWVRERSTAKKFVGTRQARWKHFTTTTTGRVLTTLVILVTCTLVPYLLFVNLVVLRGVDNLSETVPGDYYFIRDASVSWLHVFSWDLAGIMDKIIYGDYLAKTPRVTNLAYTLLFLAPFLIPPIRRALVTSRPHRQLFAAFTALSIFSVWATVGYAEPQWFPSFHRTLAAVTQTVSESSGPASNAIVSLSSALVQVLRFPHRFQLILFLIAPIALTLTMAWGAQKLERFYLRNRFVRTLQHRATLTHVTIFAVTSAMFFAPLLVNANYRAVLSSGNFGTFLAPYPLADLKELKQQFATLPEGKTVVLPPTETAKLVTDSNGVNHKFIDKFFIYYLDQPSFYYGLTGDRVNKFEFFLLLRGMYYQQDWWINIARDIGLKYIVVNKQLRDNDGVGAEYLPDVETFIGPALERQEQYGFAEQLFENESYVLYEITDQPQPSRPTLLINSSWSEYVELLHSRLELTQCYNLEYLPYIEENVTPDHIFAGSNQNTALDVWVMNHRERFFSPSPKMFPFNENIVASSYYLSPMFRSFLMFSMTKWNRTEMITPSVFGTLEGSFIATPNPTTFTIPVRTPEPGTYRVLLRGAATGNTLTVSSAELNETLELRPRNNNVNFYSADDVYSPDREPTDVSGLSVAELETALDEGLVPVNTQNDYFDLGVITTTSPDELLTFTKHDSNPLLIEGVVLVPENEYQTLVTSPAPNTITPNTMGCNTEFEVFGPNSDRYVDTTKNAEHANLSEDELLTLAAAGLTEIVPDDTGGVGSTLIILMLAPLPFTILLVVFRKHSKKRLEAHE